MPHQSLFLRKLKDSLANDGKKDERPFLLSDNWVDSVEQDYNFGVFVDGECFSPINPDDKEFKFESNTSERRTSGNIAEEKGQSKLQLVRSNEKNGKSSHEE